MTRNPRYHNAHMNSFFGYWLYGMTLDDDHPLVALLELIDWEKLTGHLIKLYKGKGLVGRPPYNPAILLKMLFLSFLYSRSERDIERDINDSLYTKYFFWSGFSPACSRSQCVDGVQESDHCRR